MGRRVGLVSGGLGTREGAIERLSATAKDPLDVLVVGGGITGAGVALDASSRGMKVGLVERFDFASGTSSKSSKLVHGGLRYLEQREFGLMREAATERDLLRRLAPHLVQPIPFVLPVSHRTTRAKFGVGLWAYDALASFKNMHFHKHLDGSDAEALIPPLPPGKIRGGYVFYDCKTDDVRLVMENLVQSRRYATTVLNHAVVRHMDGGSELCSAMVEDSCTGSLFEIRAKRIVVAAGVWADRVEALANDSAHPRLTPSKGIHLVFSRDRLPMGDAGAFIPDAERRRMLFVIPWLDSVLVGTTDTSYAGSLDRPVVEQEDRRYCLDALNAIFRLDLTDEDIAGAYAGLRPLIAGKKGSTADLSRRHAVYDIAPNIIGITGGKMTTYRRMAKDAVDRVSDGLGETGRSKTHWIRLGSSHVGSLTAAVDRRCRHLGIAPDSAAHLVQTYGDRALNVLDLAAEHGLIGRMAPGFAPVLAEAAYAVRAEMATDLSDLLSRRTRLSLIDPQAGIGAGSTGADALASELGWSEHERARQLEAHRMEVEHERGLPLHPSPTGSSTVEASARALSSG